MLCYGKSDMKKMRLTDKGRVVIPSEMRTKLGIKTGTRILVELDERAGRIIMRPITRDFVHSLRGRFRGKGLLKALMAEKNRERQL